MTILEIVNKLSSQGHSITYRVRSDGGILITSINGKKFSGAEGNKVARFMVGATLSQNRTAQLAKIKPPKGKSPKSRKKKKIRKDVLKLLHKVQRAEAQHRKEDEDFTQRTTSKNVRYNLENLGLKETMNKLRQNLKYAQGFAYDKNIDALIGYISEVNRKLKSKALRDLINLIDENRDRIREEYIKDAYDQLYGLNQGVSAEDVATNVKIALHL